MRNALLSFRRPWVGAIVPALAFAVLSATGCGDGTVTDTGTQPATDAGPGDATAGSETTFPVLDVGGTETDAGAPDANDIGGPDVGGPDTVEDTGTGPEEGETGWPCSEDLECNSEFCITEDDGSGGYCSELCQTDCPLGYVCTNQPQIGDVVFLCVKVDPTTCVKQCTNPGTFKGCGVPGAMCADVNGEAWCLDRCETNANCPDDYTCTEMLDEDDFPLGKQCWPNSGSCSCGTDINVQTDPNNCGECGEACVYDNALPLCVDGGCRMGPCEAGFTDLNNATNDGCEYVCEPTSEDDLPDPDALDANCDGVDGERDRAVFVAPDGTDDNDEGTIDYPFKSIGAAIVFADAQTPKRMVLVAEGSYLEQVRVRNGVTVAGGYDRETWRRDPEVHETIVVVSQLEPSAAIRALVADDITVPTLVTGLTLRTTNNPSPGGPTQAVWTRNCGPDLRILANRLEPGDGGPGMPGTPGTDGNDGVDGQPGETGGPENWWNPSITIVGGPPGDTDCPSGDSTVGGKGGDAGWGNNPTFDNNKPAKPGDDAPIGGDGGDAGGTKQAGGPGDPGDDGSKGFDGGAGGADGTVDSNGNWFPATGVSGTNGGNGEGGGGGGGGGGGEDQETFIDEHSHGGGGGGGASGGCGGTGGIGGGGGGGSFGVFVASGGPIIEDNVILLGSGGDGGDGGAAGKGGKRGTGGTFGTGGGSAGNGGYGGDGGVGGRGGHGGGGGGGPSIGIYLVLGAIPQCYDNSLQGTPKPGDGGYNIANSGADGFGGLIGPTTIVSCE